MGNNHEVLVSIIVPVYNTKDYLVRCFDSLKAQTLDSIEFIIVDDGSTDGSGALCDEYALNYPWFRVIHQNNGGISSARNMGLSIATGKYVMFVDSDDWVTNDFCESAVSIAEAHHADVVAFRYNRVNGDEYRVFGPSDDVLGVHTNLDALGLIDECEGYAWNKIYLRDKCFSNLTFPVGFCFEDQGTIHRAIYKADLVCFSNKVLYNYAYRDDSIVSKVSPKKENDRFVMDLLQANDLENWGLYSLAKAKKYYTSYRYLCYLGMREEHSSEAIAILSEYDGSKKYFTKKNRCLIYLFLISKPLFNYACILTGRRYRDED